MMKVVALAGGVGGAKLADGLAQALPPENLTVIVNTGDDFEHLGLKISPDLDTVCYTLAGLANPVTGWGRAGETFNMLESLGKLGGPTWFGLGDHDLATHLERTLRLKNGQSLSQVTRDFCTAWGVGPTVLPMSDDLLSTLVETDQGVLAFQDYFVRRKCEPVVRGFRFDGLEKAAPAPGVLEALQQANLVVICPSNPWVSIDPILALPGIQSSLLGQALVIAVSPIIGGKTVKGPAAKMYTELGIEPSALAVARHYGPRSGRGLLAGFVLDQVDLELLETVAAEGIQPYATDTFMVSPQDRLRLAQEILSFGERLWAA
jgi:LPPG:FO 2-phospho-L-lactate transferase